jgi:hypothetical protein
LTTGGMDTYNISVVCLIYNYFHLIVSMMGWVSKHK